MSKTKIAYPLFVQIRVTVNDKWRVEMDDLFANLIEVNNKPITLIPRNQFDGSIPFTEGDLLTIDLYTNESKPEVYSFFEDLKSKNHPFQKRISKGLEYRRFFDARIVKKDPKNTVIIPWTIMLERYIDISYRWKIKKGATTYLTKTIFHFPPVLVPSHDFPNVLRHNDSKILAYKILNQYFHRDDFEIVKIEELEELQLLP